MTSVTPSAPSGHLPPSPDLLPPAPDIGSSLSQSEARILTQWPIRGQLLSALHNPRPVPPIHISDAGTLSLRDFKLETV